MMKTTGTQIKGASIKARLDFLEEAHGSEVLEQVLAKLTEGDRACLDHGLLPSSWYPLELNESLDEAIASVLDPEHPTKVFRVLGTASAESNLLGFHRVFLQGRGPHDILSSFPYIRRTYYSDGDAEHKLIDETHGLICLSGASSHTVADCVSTAGYFERAIELVGGSASQVELSKCRGYGDPVCEFLCSWQ